MSIELASLEIPITVTGQGKAQADLRETEAVGESVAQGIATSQGKVQSAMMLTGKVIRSVITSIMRMAVVGLIVAALALAAKAIAKLVGQTVKAKEALAAMRKSLDNVSDSARQLADVNEYVTKRIEQAGGLIGLSRAIPGLELLANHLIKVAVEAQKVADAYELMNPPAEQYVRTSAELLSQLLATGTATAAQQRTAAGYAKYYRQLASETELLPLKNRYLNMAIELEGRLADIAKDKADALERAAAAQEKLLARAAQAIQTEPTLAGDNATGTRDNLSVAQRIENALRYIAVQRELKQAIDDTTVSLEHMGDANYGIDPALTAIEDRAKELASTLNSVALGAISGIAAGLGAALAGDGGIGDVLLGALGSAFQQFGAAIIAGAAIIQAALASLSSLNPAAAIALGAALIAVGSFLSTKARKSFGGATAAGYGGGQQTPFGDTTVTRGATPGGKAATSAAARLQPATPVQQFFTIIGPNDPGVQRQIALATAGAKRRGY